MTSATFVGLSAKRGREPITTAKHAALIRTIVVSIVGLPVVAKFEPKKRFAAPFRFLTYRLGMPATIVALDLSKYKTVACVYHSKAAHAFRSLDAASTNHPDVECWLSLGRTRKKTASFAVCSSGTSLRFH